MSRTTLNCPRHLASHVATSTLTLALVVLATATACTPTDVTAVRDGNDSERASGEGEGEGEPGEGEGEPGEGEGEPGEGEGEPGEGEGEPGEGEGEPGEGEGEPVPEGCEACPDACRVDADTDGNARCMVSDPSWSCDSSEYEGAQYWTCADGDVHACEDGVPLRVECEAGCVFGPLATDDRCRVAGDAPPVPHVNIVISGGLFSESEVRPLIEAGLASMQARLYERVAIPADRSMPDITVFFSPSNNSFCSGIAFSDSTEVSCPYDYPISGDNQNFVVNITMHEIGHLLAHHLIAPGFNRDTCENEGIATWIARDYWANAGSVFVGSLREAARRQVQAGAAVESMQGCVSASDAYYKVYGSFFEYLDEEVPGGVMSVGSGAETATDHQAAWQSWL